MSDQNDPMTNPNHEVERFKLYLRNHLPDLEADPKGPLVRYSDYEKMVKQRDADYRRFAEAKDALTTIERAAIEAQEERDQAKAQALAEVREALKPVIERLERIRDIDEQTSDGALGSLARYALDDLSTLDQGDTECQTQATSDVASLQPKSPEQQIGDILSEQANALVDEVLDQEGGGR